MPQTQTAGPGHSYPTDEQIGVGLGWEVMQGDSMGGMKISERSVVKLAGWLREDTKMSCCLLVGPGI
jgi:hypothetical protein